MQTIMLCVVLSWLYWQFLGDHGIHLPIFFTDTDVYNSKWQPFCLGLHVAIAMYIIYNLGSFLSVNSLAPGRTGCHFRSAIFNLVLLISIFTSSNDNAHRWMPWDLTHNKSTLVQVMAWCRQATSHYLSQYWPSSMSPYGVTRPK